LSKLTALAASFQLQCPLTALEVLATVCWRMQGEKILLRPPCLSPTLLLSLASGGEEDGARAQRRGADAPACSTVEHWGVLPIPEGADKQGSKGSSGCLCWGGSPKRFSFSKCAHQVSHHVAENQGASSSNAEPFSLAELISAWGPLLPPCTCEALACVCTHHKSQNRSWPACQDAFSVLQLSPSSLAGWISWVWRRPRAQWAKVAGMWIWL